MNETITNFLHMKKQAADLENSAKKELQAEFSQALTDAVNLFNTFKDTFGGKPELPSGVRTFTVNDVPKRKSKTNGKTTDAPAGNANGKKVGGLKRALTAQQEKLVAAKEAGKVTKDIEDRIYEITDELQQLGVSVTANPPAPPISPAPVPAGDSGQLDLS